MDKTEAISIVKNLGFSYFYIFSGEMRDEDILAIIKGHIIDSKNKNVWKKNEEAIRVALETCSDEELDIVYLDDYAHSLEHSNSRSFLKDLADFIHVENSSIEK